MHVLIGITGIFLLIYALLIFFYHRIWDRIPPIITPGTDSPLKEVTRNITKVSVIIPARNEASRIENCLKSLIGQSYSSENTELIIVDDFSTDATTERVMAYTPKIKLIHLADHVSGPLNSYKKKAIETGIAHSCGELIICTDADCRMGPDWIQTIVAVYEKEHFQFMAAPVKILTDKSFLSLFQALDFISLQGITGASVYRNLYPMCNGANMAYTRAAYEAVGGFRSIDQIASGDDMLLMKKIQAKFPGRSGYIKAAAAIVSTLPAENIKAFFKQRIRWASKMGHYKDPATFITLALVYVVNLFLLTLFLSCFFQNYWRWLLILVVFKTISEIFFVSKVADFFQQQSLIKYFPFCQPFHILYTVIAGSFGSFGKYEWKNRKVK